MTSGASRRSVRWVAAAAAAQTGLSALTVFLSAPAILASLGAATFGAWAGLNELLAWVLVADFGLGGVIVQRVAAAEASGDRRLARQVLGGGLAVTGLGAMCVSVALAAAASLYLTRVAPTDAPVLAAVFACGVAAFLVSTVYAVLYAYARGAQDAAPLAAATIASAVALLAGTVAGVAWGLGLWALVWGWGARAVVLAAGAGWFAHTRRLRVRGWWDRAVTAAVLRLAPVTGAHAALCAVAANCDTLLIAVLGSPTAAGTYFLARRAFDLARAVGEAVSQAQFGAIAFEAARGGAPAAVRAAWFGRMLPAIGGAAMVSAVNPGFLAWWAGISGTPRALHATLAMATVVNGQAYLMNVALRAVGAHTAGTVAMGLEAALRVAVAVPMIQRFGAEGAAMGAAMVGVASIVGHAWALRARRALVPLSAGDAAITGIAVAVVGAGAFAATAVGTPAGLARDLAVGSLTAIVALAPLDWYRRKRRSRQ